MLAAASSDPAAQGEIREAASANGMIMDEDSGLREGYAGVGDQRLHYVEAGEGPPIVLLHGFPEFWYGWRLRDASHWVHHDEAERVNQLLTDFFAPAQPARN